MIAAVCQTDIAFEKKIENIMHASELVKNAAKHSADICLFPEMSFTGFSMNTELTGETDLYTVNKMRGLAAEYSIAIGFGYVGLYGGKAENRYAIADSTGELISDYTKIHSFVIGGESEGFRSGNSLPDIIRIAGQDISTFICYDLRFPEIFRANADKSTVMVVAANWPAKRREQWMTLLRARAIENQVYIIAVNCCGKQGDIEYSGDSMVIDAFGNVMEQAEPYREEILFAQIPDNLVQLRSEFPVLDSRKTDLYKKILI